MIKTALEKTTLWLEQSQNLQGLFGPSAEQLLQLESYLDLLILWSSRVDLVALASRQELIDRHLVDCSAAFLLINSKIHPLKTCLDVGSGAGLPGIIFSILEPSSLFYLCEPREKRQIFLKEAIQKLSLNNVEILGCRLEEIPQNRRFDFICSRALGMEDVFDKQAHLYLAEGGTICQMLGPSWSQEKRIAPTSILNYKLFKDGPERKLVFWT